MDNRRSRDMRRCLFFVSLAALLMPAEISAEEVTVVYTIPPVAIIREVDNPVILILSTVTGNAFETASDVFHVEINYNGSTPQKVTALMDSAIGAGTKLTIQATATEVGTVTEKKTLCEDAVNSPADVLTGISNEGGTVTFQMELDANMNAAAASSQSKTMTLTLLDQ